MANDIEDQDFKYLEALIKEMGEKHTRAIQEISQEIRDQSHKVMEEIKQMIRGITLQNNEVASQSHLDVANRNDGILDPSGHSITASHCTTLECPSDGCDLHEWLYKLEQFFELDHTAEFNKVKVASAHLDGKALNWFKALLNTKDKGKTISWNEFVLAITARFGEELFLDPVSELKNLNKKGSLQQYLEEFDYAKLEPIVVLKDGISSGYNIFIDEKQLRDVTYSSVGNFSSNDQQQWAVIVATYLKPVTNLFDLEILSWKVYDGGGFQDLKGCSLLVINSTIGFINEINAGNTAIALMTGLAPNTIQSLEDAQQVGVEMKSKLDSFRGATLAITEVQQFTNDVHTKELLYLSGLLNEEEFDPYVRSSLMDMYVEMGAIEATRALFNEMLEKSVNSWNVLIASYIKCCMFEEANSAFLRMEKSGVELNEATLVTTLSACVSLGDLEIGKKVHDFMENREFKGNILLNNALLDMYTQCGYMSVARRLFDENEMTSKDVISWTSIVSGYANSGMLDEAWKLFDRSPGRDLVLWTATIKGYMRYKRLNEALVLFRELQTRRIMPDNFIVVALLTLCANLADLAQEKWIHGFIKENKTRIDAAVETALIDMHTKYGCIQESLDICRKIVRKDTTTCISIIFKLAMNGQIGEALKLFSEMQRKGVKSDDINFIGVQIACSHGGLVDEGLQCLHSMKEKDLMIWNAIIFGYVQNGSETEDAPHPIEVHKFPLRTREFKGGVLMCNK